MLGEDRDKESLRHYNSPSLVIMVVADVVFYFWASFLLTTWYMR